MTDMTEPPDRLDKLEIRDAARRAREDTEVRGELER